MINILYRVFISVLNLTTEKLSLYLLIHKNSIFFYISPSFIGARAPYPPPPQVNEGLYRHKRIDYDILVSLCLSFSFPFSFSFLSFLFLPLFFFFGGGGGGARARRAPPLNPRLPIEGDLSVSPKVVLMQPSMGNLNSPSSRIVKDSTLSRRRILRYMNFGIGES